MTQIVEAALELLETEGADALTMRRLGEVVGIRAASLYKHLPGKAAIESALIEIGLTLAGEAMHAAIQGVGPDGGRAETVRALLTAYRDLALAHPNLYRLMTAGPLARDRLRPGLEDWAGEPFLLATGDPYVGQALFSATHGVVILTLDGRYPPDTDLELTWRALVAAFAGAEAPDHEPRARPGHSP